MKFWQVAVLIGLGLVLGWFIWGREPPPPEVVTVTKTDTLARIDTVEVVPPRLKARITALEAAGRIFLVDTINQTLDTCLGLVGAFLAEIDSLKAALTVRPALHLTLSDSSTLKYPVQAFWVGVNYQAVGDSAARTWSYRLHSARPPPKSGFGVVFTYSTNGEYFYGGQIRVSKNAAIQIQKAKTGWTGGIAYFIF